MLRYLFPLVLCLCVASSCSKRWKSDSANGAIEKQSQRFAAQHGFELKSLQKKQAPDGRIQRVNVGYFSESMFDMDEAREKLVSVVDGILRRLNEDPRTKGQLEPYPFTGDQVDVVIKVDSFLGDFFDRVYVGRIVLNQGLVYYYGFDGKLMGREPFAESSQMVRDKQLQEVRVADSYQSAYRKQWLAEAHKSIEIGQIAGELEEGIENEPQVVSGQRSTSPGTKPSAKVYIPDYSVTPRSSSPLSEVSTSKNTRTATEERPKSVRELPQLFDGAGAIRLGAEPTLDETVYKSYADERRPQRATPQVVVHDDKIDEIVLGLIEDEVKSSAREPVQKTTARQIHPARVKNAPVANQPRKTEKLGVGDDMVDVLKVAQDLVSKPNPAKGTQVKSAPSNSVPVQVVHAVEDEEDRDQAVSNNVPSLQVDNRQMHSGNGRVEMELESLIESAPASGGQSTTVYPTSAQGGAEREVEVLPWNDDFTGFTIFSPAAGASQEAQADSEMPRRADKILQTSEPEYVPAKPSVRPSSEQSVLEPIDDEDLSAAPPAGLDALRQFQDSVADQGEVIVLPEA